MTEQTSKRLQGALLRIRGEHPFLGTLALFADIQVVEEVATAATDGKSIWFNPAFVAGLELNELYGLVAHELLHAALQHGARRGVREPRLWNIAADVVVNGMVRADTAYALPKGGVEMPKLAHLSVEEIYEQLACGRMKAPSITLLDLVATGLQSGEGPQGEGVSTGLQRGALEDSAIADLQRHWRTALQQAGAVARRVAKGMGHRGLGSLRDLAAASASQIDWKEALWQFVVSTPHDFQGFDRRFVHRKLYLEAMEGESVEVAICIDTSGSVDAQALSAFMAEVQAILDAYPQIHGSLYYADAALYGPHEFAMGMPIPKPQGGGGTSFVPFFERTAASGDSLRDVVCVYLTDGYGSFPSKVPSGPVLWVVSEGGLSSTDFPFGTVVRMGTR
jgi:predicted metal-dependent peptidase